MDRFNISKVLRCRIIEKLKAIIEQQTADDWETLITTKEFGTKTKAEAFGKIVSHTLF